MGHLVQKNVPCNHALHAVAKCIASCHRDGGRSQGDTRHSMPPARKWGGFNLDE